MNVKPPKTCDTCGKSKPVSDFSKSNYTQDKRCPSCKQCNKEKRELQTEYRTDSSGRHCGVWAVLDAHWYGYATRRQAATPRQGGCRTVWAVGRQGHVLGGVGTTSTEGT